MTSVKDNTVEMAETKKEMLADEEDRELIEALCNYVPHSAEEKKLVRKIDAYLMPILWIMYILNYVDRTNIVCHSQTQTIVIHHADANVSNYRATQRLRACKLTST